MATTYPLSTLGPTITAAGITAPSLNDILLSLQASFQQIYGSDIVITPDSQDGQWLAVLAKGYDDVNKAAVALYNSFSPYYAQGVQLSSLVKLSAITRNVPTNSTAVGTVTGTSGTVINNGVVRDISGNLWNLPASVTIPTAGTITVTVTAQTAGAITAQIGDISQIFTPQYGWTSFINTTSATAGSPVESDAALRQRQAQSSALPALSILAAIYAAVGNVAGITRWALYENATGSTDANGVPAHAFAVVTEGGSSASIAAAIYSRKPPGIQTYGTITVQVTDPLGFPVNINYFVLAYVQIYVNVTIQSLTGYTTTIGAELSAAVLAFVNGLKIGESVYYSQVNAAASLINLPDGQTYYIQSLTVCTKSFTASISGTVLTVSAMTPGSAAIQVGDTVFGALVAANTTITSLGTGTGGTGTYNLSGGAQTVLSEAMTSAQGAGVANVTIPFNQAAQTSATAISLTVH